MISPLIAAPDVTAARALIEGSGLVFEPAYDALIGLHEGGRLIGVGARIGNILKMLAVAPSHQGGSAFSEIVSALVSQGIDAGHRDFFVFTKPKYAATFEALNFSLLASHEKVALLEYGGGFRHWMTAHAGCRRPGRNGALVIDCAAFSADRRWLVERAAAQVDTLYLLVVRAERTPVPFAAAYRQVAEAVRDLANVVVVDNPDYSVSAANFQRYFLKHDDPVANIQMELDVILFATRIAPCFGISRRFVGSDQNHTYNTTLRRLLPEYGIEPCEIDPQPQKEEVHHGNPQEEPRRHHAVE